MFAMLQKLFFTYNNLDKGNSCWIVGSNYEASIEIGRDPTTCVDGCTFDFGWSANNTCRELSFELAGEIPPTSGTATASTYYVIFDVRVPDCQMDLCVHVHTDCRRINRPLLKKCLSEEIKNLIMYKEGLNYTIPSYPAYDSGEDETTFRYRVCTAKKHLNCTIRRCRGTDYLASNLSTRQLLSPILSSMLLARDSYGVHNGQDLARWMRMTILKVLILSWTLILVLED